MITIDTQLYGTLLMYQKKIPYVNLEKLFTGVSKHCFNHWSYPYTFDTWEEGELMQNNFKIFNRLDYPSLVSITLHKDKKEYRDAVVGDTGMFLCDFNGLHVFSSIKDINYPLYLTEDQYNHNYRNSYVGPFIYRIIKMKEIRNDTINFKLKKIPY